jgi:hypothetical protein
MDCGGSHDENDEAFSRRTIEVGRDWKCGWEGCEKAFKSVSSCVKLKANMVISIF